MLNKLKNLEKFFVPVGFFFIFLGLLFRNLQYAKIPFLEWDEGIYSQIAKEVIGGNLLPTTFNGHLWLEKPPLIPGLLAIDFRIFGYSEFWARMLMVVLALVLCILVFLLTKKIILDLELNKKFKASETLVNLISFLPSLAVLSIPLVLERSTDVSTDLMLALGWVGFFLFRKSFSGKLLFTILGVGAKSLFGFYPLILDSILLALQREFKKLFANIVIGLISSAWYIWGYLKFGNQFINLHFWDQLIKRATAPIELHFGGRLYYPEILFNNLFIILPFLILSFIFLASVFIRPNLLKNIKKNSETYLILLVPFPFLVFLFFTVSKLSWYVVPTIPFLLIPLGFFVFALKNQKLKYGLIFLIYLLLLLSFVPNTYLLKMPQEAHPKLEFAKCLSQKNGEIAFLVNDQERRNQNVLEAANLQTANSFIYGGSPAFVYYVNKPVSFYYNVQKFKNELDGSSIAVVSDADLRSLNLDKSRKYREICSIGDFKAFEAR